LDIAQSGPLIGGIDCDSGVVEVSQASGGWTRVRATKRVRITQPSTRRDAYNFNLAGALPFWLRNLVLLGICEEASGSSSTVQGEHTTMANQSTGTSRAERAKANFANLTQRQDALLAGLKQHAADINGVVMDALSDDYSPQKWLKDMTALWINGSAIWPNALLGTAVVDPEEDP
jgi:hypothetical protein